MTPPCNARGTRYDSRRVIERGMLFRKPFGREESRCAIAVAQCAVSLSVLRAVIVDRVLDALSQVAPTERLGQTVLDAEVLDLVLEEHQA